MDEADKNTLFTVAYFNAMNFCPTTFEVWRHYIDIKKSKKGISLLEANRALSRLKDEGFIISRQGFWKISNKETLDFFCSERILKQKISIQKIKKALWWIGFLRHAPFLRGAIFNGTLAMKNATKTSDWDVLLICKKGSIWLGRFFASLFLILAFKKRYGENVKDKFCLNHFVAEDGLILEENNIFVAYLNSFSFRGISEKFFKKFFQLNNPFSRVFMPNFAPDLIGSPKFGDTKEVSVLARTVEVVMEELKIAGFLNKLIGRVMIWKINRNPKTKKPGADIRTSSQALVFLPSPKREACLQKTKKILASIDRKDD